MGSFIIRPTVLTQGGTPLGDYGSPPVDHYAEWLIEIANIPGNTIVKSVNGTALVPGVNDYFLAGQVITSISNPSLSFIQTLRFGFSGASIYLDGSITPIPFSNLQPGFAPLSAIVKVFPYLLLQPTGGSIHYHLQQDPLSIGVVDTSSYPYDFLFPPPTMLDIINNGIGFDVDINVTDANDIAYVIINNLRIEGTYTLQGYQFTLTPTNTLTKVGDNITITSPSGNANSLGLSNVSINISYYDSTNTLQIVNISPTSQSFNQYTFTMPNFDGAVQVTVNAVGDGTQFSGSIPLGSMPTINFTNGTGIYKLVIGKTSDTLYAQGTSPIQTVEVAIPNPFIKTAFIPI